MKGMEMIVWVRDVGEEAGDRYTDTGHTCSALRSLLDRQAGRGSIMVVMILL